MGKRESIVQDDKTCFICGNPYVQCHHLYKSHKCRQIADREGLFIYLCPNHHHEVHHNRELDLDLMKLGQEIFEKTHTREEFREMFVKSYL